MATKAKNSKKQQQTVTTAIVTPNFFVVPDEILDKISTTDQMEIESTASPPFSGAADSSA
ncbi:hypothetical protein G9A89_022537 [Geosiphon pyriformis]|nr:hypothetical protein G9A89_022537 [Geosiphon pyriformis]